jgi:putative hemolysin
LDGRLRLAVTARHAAGGLGIEGTDAEDRMQQIPSAPPPFSAGELIGGRWLRALLAPALDHLLALPALARSYHAIPRDGGSFWDRALAALGVEYVVSGAAPIVPATGPLIVAANHPFGGLDGLVLGSLVGRIRPDFKILGNSVLARIPELAPYLVPVGVSGSRAARTANVAALRAARRWLEAGGALGVFPAGEVSHLRRGDPAPIDPAWSPSIARLAARAAAPVLPIYFHGRNSRSFYLAGRIHPQLRTALLARELLRARGTTVRLDVGTLIPASRIQSFPDAEHASSYVRLRTYALASAVPIAAATPQVPIATPEPAAVLAGEIAALPGGRELASNGALTVVVGSAVELPHVVCEIGRLREIAFRAVGEGAGRARDLDAYDERYLHLLVWNRERQEIVGAYRLGRTDAGTGSPADLYTSTLFDYDRTLLDELGPALELGRAFVRPEYQRDYSPLLLLWKGIGAYVARNPRYRVLFGTVSISREYQSLSQQILARFLYATSYRADLGRRIRPRTPPPFLRDGRSAPHILGAVARTIADVGALVAEIESDGKGVPVLLRQYLKLNAKLLGFNVDEAFGGVLDGLMMVDLLDVEPSLRVRYMGRAGDQAFCEWHRRRDERRLTA